MPVPYLIFGTGNRRKGIEASEIVAATGVVLKTLADYPNAIDVVEDGATFLENARKKAVQQALHLQNWVLAEDAGLCVDRLGGAPGIYSARFAGENPKNDERNNDLLLEKLDGVPLEKRTAHYTSAMVLADPSGEIALEIEEYCRGRVIFERRGTNGFGYDPLFEIVELHKTFGELAPEIKRAISHRARAVRRLIPTLYELVAAGKLPTE
ncbi:MAG: RdgB/HAM1 family non-canonical purine NTP pyrophosphatase [Thermoguttaceae bacterium]|nr:RdgB/HAM1 family non-canonical purine NTP pyrophosphatase [Thermoguttaceae bacterium]